jgi:GDP-L-fucose synthase
MVGAALVRLLRARGFTNLLLRTRAELDLCDARAVRAFYEKHRPDYVLIAAAKVGGIWANADPAGRISQREPADRTQPHQRRPCRRVKKLLFLGSSCIYPKLAPQPMKEDALLTGSLEPTNEAYALAKICGIRLCQAYARQYGANFISAMPTNLYGPEDNFDLETSHVLPALIHKFHLAKEKGNPASRFGAPAAPTANFCTSTIWPRRASFLMETYDSPELINVGCGRDITIRELAELVGKRGRLFRPNRMGHHQAGRHAAQIARCLQAEPSSAGRRGFLSRRAFAPPTNGGGNTAVSKRIPVWRASL